MSPSPFTTHVTSITPASASDTVWEESAASLATKSTTSLVTIYIRPPYGSTVSGPYKPPLLTGDNALWIPSVTLPSDQEKTKSINEYLIGPLTTAFKFPDDCAMPLMFAGYNSSDFTAYQAVDCGTIVLPYQRKCWPLGAPRLSSGQKEQTPSVGFYSPGVICPKNYTSACTSIFGENASGAFSFAFPPSEKETAVGCCPSGYSCANTGGYQSCIAETDSTVLSVAACMSSTIRVNYASPFTIPYTSDDGLVANSLHLQAPLIQLKWKEADRTVGISANTASESGLSSTAIITLATTIPAVVLAATIVFVWWMLRRRKQRRRQAEEEAEKALRKTSEEKAELPVAGAEISELYDHPRELAAEPVPPRELDGTSTGARVHELSADNTTNATRNES
ncbi:uncharacterized protein K452DRAFT_330364 [Aplosporella prunicola CBS 121167]|uniref:Uncharacterized protein n=1 Tax=Aplosporella prunicola CBS 121167 TaxID=1176127 RepID=A0A6A6BSD1_9PEZI|nr:uncharacterized protein K452DRAFT_330364 [Aplosporella prunicola CBS 121167]KAF2147009.1 hypothetical protein K452DRAFT_330364 [Aplosporella prunicola CBS 121167]